MVGRSHLLSWHRVALVALLVALAALAFTALRGPQWFQRVFYPLDHVDAIASSAARHRVNPYLVAAVINEESGFDPQARSRAGAVGLMQLMPATADELRLRSIVDSGVVATSDLTDPAVNIEYGTAYLRFLIERYHEVEIALAAYNAGLRNADAWAAQGGDIRDAITFPETRHFVVRVVRAKERYEQLYPGVFE
ncbi:MAG: lytic transglycosylase domain-containing protein [Clostridiales bacterium]|nr:lytic transglycosylase domain-containing protein [Clostridiales bacterium]